MTTADYNGLLLASPAGAATYAAADWTEVHWFNYLRKYKLIDGSFYRGFGPLMRRRTADGTFEYRKLKEHEIDDLRSFEQQW
jgi:hypothetical protein